MQTPSPVGPTKAAWCMDRPIGAGWLVGIGLAPLFPTLDACFAVQVEPARCHHIPRQHHKVTNWPAYEAGMRQRGNLTVWFIDEAVAARQPNHARPAVAELSIRRWRS